MWLSERAGSLVFRYVRLKRQVYVMLLKRINRAYVRSVWLPLRPGDSISTTIIVQVKPEDSCASDAMSRYRRGFRPRGYIGQPITLNIHQRKR